MAKDPMKEERMKILELLTKGTITAEQAENLLSAMGESEEKEPDIILPQKKRPIQNVKNQS